MDSLTEVRLRIRLRNELPSSRRYGTEPSLLSTLVAMVKRQASKEAEGGTAAGTSSGEPQPASPSVVSAPAADTTPSEGETHSAGSRVPSRGHMADGDGCTTPSLLDAAWPSSHTESPSPRRRPRIRTRILSPGTGCTRRTGTPLRPAPSGGSTGLMGLSTRSAGLPHP